MKGEYMTSDDIIKALKIVKQYIPDMFPDTLIPHSETYWRKHYPEWFND